jgi:hypothetical protein
LGRLGNEGALLDLAERFDDPAIFEKVKLSSDQDSRRAVEIAERWVATMISMLG